MRSNGSVICVGQENEKETINRINVNVGSLTTLIMTAVLIVGVEAVGCVGWGRGGQGKAEEVQMYCKRIMSEII